MQKFKVFGKCDKGLRKVGTIKALTSEDAVEKSIKKYYRYKHGTIESRGIVLW